MKEKNCWATKIGICLLYAKIGICLLYYIINASAITSNIHSQGNFIKLEGSAQSASLH